MVHNFPLVSIIITCFNYGDYLREALESTLRQTYKNVEIIVIDDGSNDINTLNSVHDLKIKYPNVKFILSTNNGPSSARNKAIKLSSGVYIFPLDADDFICDNCIELMVNAISENNKCSPVYCNANYFGDKQFSFSFEEWSFQKLKKKNFVLSCSLYSKEAWRACNGYDEYLFGLEDYELWIHMAKKGFIGKKIDSYLVNIRLHANVASVTSSSLKKDPKDRKTKYIFIKHKLNLIGIILNKIGKIKDPKRYLIGTRT